MVNHTFILNNLWDEARILIGQKEINKGIKAPIISGSEIENFQLNGDNIKIISNNNKLWYGYYFLFFFLQY